MSYDRINNANTSLIDQDDLIENDSNVQSPYTNYNSSQSQPEPPGKASGKSHMFQIHFYRQYFDLNTEEFLQKVRTALNPFDRTSFSIEHNDNEAPTELYGPIWITATLIFLMFVSATGSNMLSHWLHPGKEDHKYEYNFDLLTKSITLFYGYNIIVPAAIYGVTTWGLKFPRQISLSKLISIYGYTNVLWFPITLISILVVLFISNEKHHFLLELIEWIFVGLTGVLTGIRNIFNITPVIMANAMILYDNDASKANKLTMAFNLTLGTVHLLFAVLVKASYFGIDV